MEQKNGAWEKKDSIPIGDLLKGVNEAERVHVYHVLL